MAALQDITVRTIAGEAAALRDYAGQVCLVVNVASKCGLTPQYEGLETLYRHYRDQGFVILGFPTNDFGGQEPGTEAEIAAFCETNYAVDFPLFAKIRVTGPEKHELYATLTRAQPHAASTSGDDLRARLAGHGLTPNPEPEILWNFEKFLFGRDGEVVARFAPDTVPNDPALIAAIERELASAP
jgi:glutathione peroxidase